jgi:hypothetical protein
MRECKYLAFIIRSIDAKLDTSQASVLRAALGEITDASNEGWVYPLWSISWDLSIIIGPLIGSTLSNPAKQYPNSWFGQIPLFKTFPYLPPCLFVAALAWISLLMAALLFEEVRACLSPQRRTRVNLPNLDGPSAHQRRTRFGSQMKTPPCFPDRTTKQPKGRWQRRWAYSSYCRYPPSSTS